MPLDPPRRPPLPRLRRAQPLLLLPAQQPGRPRPQNRLRPPLLPPAPRQPRLHPIRPHPGRRTPRRQTPRRPNRQTHPQSHRLRPQKPTSHQTGTGRNAAPTSRGRDLYPIPGFNRERPNNRHRTTPIGERSIINTRRTAPRPPGRRSSHPTCHLSLITHSRFKYAFASSSSGNCRSSSWNAFE